MAIIRIIKPNRWEIVLESKSIYGSAQQIAVMLRARGMSAEKVNTEVHVQVPEDPPF